MRQKRLKTPKEYLDDYEHRLKSNPWAHALQRRSHKQPVMTPTFCRTKRKPAEECQCLRCKPMEKEHE